MSADDTGFDAAPARYTTHGREVVDIMRDACHDIAADNYDVVEGDFLFMVVCASHAMKYRLRDKDTETDAEKRRWWEQMMRHAGDPDQHPDPRAARPGFVAWSYRGETL